MKSIRNEFVLTSHSARSSPCAAGPSASCRCDATCARMMMRGCPLYQLILPVFDSKSSLEMFGS